MASNYKKVFHLCYIHGVRNMWLLITTSGSFDDEHKLAHIKVKMCAHEISEGQTFFFRDHFVFETKIEKSEPDSR